MSAKNGEGTIVTCAATHLADGAYTCENTREFLRIKVTVVLPSKVEGEPEQTLVLQLPQAPCDCIIWAGMTFSHEVRPVGEQIADLMIQKRVREQAMIACRTANRYNRQNGRH